MRQKNKNQKNLWICGQFQIEKNAQFETSAFGYGQTYGQLCGQASLRLRLPTKLPTGIAHSTRFCPQAPQVQTATSLYLRLNPLYIIDIRKARKKT